MLEFTTVVAVDAEHLEELRIVWPTWRTFRPEILQRPLLLICDGDDTGAEWRSRLSFVEHPNCRITCWSMPEASQRDKMLSSLVFGTADNVDTKWYLKLDTDAAALAPGRWLQMSWFTPDHRGCEPVFVTNPWGYTKPPDAIERLDDWADAIPALRKYPRLNLHPRPGAELLSHRRIISWCFFGRTAWTREMARCCNSELPVASQDTFLWYCAARRGEFFRTVRMSRLGWRHVFSRRKLRLLCREALDSRRFDHPSWRS